MAEQVGRRLVGVARTRRHLPGGLRVPRRTDSVTSALVPRRRVPLEEQVVLPTPHAQQDATNDGEVVRMFRVDSDLGRRAAGNIVGRRILIDVDQRHGSAARWPLSHILEGPGGLKLPGRDRVEHTTAP